MFWGWKRWFWGRATLCGRLLRALMAVPYQAFSDLDEGTVIIAEELTPADTALMDPERVGGFATAPGGLQGHTAIMARPPGPPGTIRLAGLIPQAPRGHRAVAAAGAGASKSWRRSRKRLTATELIGFVSPDADTAILTQMSAYG